MSMHEVEGEDETTSEINIANTQVDMSQKDFANLVNQSYQQAQIQEQQLSRSKISMAEQVDESANN